jgi:hypothetical protein
MALENSCLAQRALPFVKNHTFVRLIEKNFDLSLDILLPFLLKAPSWNPMVRKMTYNALKTLQNLDEKKFVKAGDAYLSSERNQLPLPSPHQDPKAQSLNHPKKCAIQNTAAEEMPLPSDFTVKSAMGNWKPPSSAAGSSFSNSTHSTMPPPINRPRSAGANPPLAVTGVAPWSMGGPSAKPMPSSNANPPLGVTGVTPWAMDKKSNPLPKTIGSLSGVTEESTVKEEKAAYSSESTSTGGSVLAYLDKIKPPDEDKGASSWSKAQMAKTPTLLPTLKFHDLVFGHDLGEGSFGSARYARLIDRSTTRSNWPEYAVKVISTKKIKEMGYEASVQRELAVLRVLSHPCIARLVSSFRFREGVYPVLEYASGGDLHTLLRKNGSLDHNSVRFVIGEVTSALASIHELVLVYADLKPENIVITETGHVKLTDFGGSRPVTEAAKQMIGESAKNVLDKLRDGDWKQIEKKKKSFDLDEDDEDAEQGHHFQDYGCTMGNGRA